MKELLDTYNKIKPDILNRIIKFKSVWNEADEEKLFQELAFCLLTPQSKAQNAWETIIKLTENRKLFEGNSAAIAEDMNLVRFRNNKAGYIVRAREMFFYNSKGIRKKLSELTSVSEKRNWLVKNVKGIGYKEASHYLRNIGFVGNLAILDRHILKNLKIYNVINEIPKSLTFDKYIRIENKMRKFSKEINISLGFLDFVFWYKETGEVFK
ncbi:MAG: N-glycosylase/DNA lyase [Bacteroidetes bacterium]|nr:N-glycosylase/DNA lyase [Bacteroidota bacterium]